MADERTSTPNLSLPLVTSAHQGDPTACGTAHNDAARALDTGPVPTQTDAAAPNGSIYCASNRAGVLTYKDGSGVTHSLTYTTP